MFFFFPFSFHFCRFLLSNLALDEKAGKFIYIILNSHCISVATLPSARSLIGLKKEALVIERNCVRVDGNVEWMMIRLRTCVTCTRMLHFMLKPESNVAFHAMTSCNWNESGESNLPQVVGEKMITIAL